MQPEFTRPEFIENNSAEEIHQRMMNNLPADIDDMPGGFPFDFTMPAALEKDEFINYHMVRVVGAYGVESLACDALPARYK